jgi:hypothetical protein
MHKVRGSKEFSAVVCRKTQNREVPGAVEKVGMTEHQVPARSHKTERVAEGVK